MHLTLQLPNWSCRLTSIRRRGSQLLPFWGSEVHYAASFLTPNLLGSAAHLRSPHTGATLRPVRPSGHSSKQRCNLCIHLFSLRVPHESAHKVSLVCVYFHPFTFVLTFIGSTLITCARFRQYTSCACLHPLVYAHLHSFVPTCAHLCPPALVYARIHLFTPTCIRLHLPALVYGFLYQVHCDTVLSDTHL